MTLTEMIAIADGATPGEWCVTEPDKHRQPVVSGPHCELATLWHHCVGSIEKEAHANALHIATFSPARVLEILRLAEQARVALAGLYSYGCPACGGDCGSANPPMVSCPLLDAHRALAAFTEAGWESAHG